MDETAEALKRLNQSRERKKREFRRFARATGLLGPLEDVRRLFGDSIRIEWAIGDAPPYFFGPRLLCRELWRRWKSEAQAGVQYVNERSARRVGGDYTLQKPFARLKGPWEEVGPREIPEIHEDVSKIKGLWGDSQRLKKNSRAS
jgi:hypothetical protein